MCNSTSSFWTRANENHFVRVKGLGMKHEPRLLHSLLLAVTKRLSSFVIAILREFTALFKVLLSLSPGQCQKYKAYQSLLENLIFFPDLFYSLINFHLFLLIHLHILLSSSNISLDSLFDFRIDCKKKNVSACSRQPREMIYL